MSFKLILFFILTILSITTSHIIIYDEVSEFHSQLCIKKSYEKCNYKLDCILNDFNRLFSIYLENTNRPKHNLYFYEDDINIQFSNEFYRSVDFDYITESFNDKFEPIYLDILKLCKNNIFCVQKIVFEITTKFIFY